MSRDNVLLVEDNSDDVELMLHAFKKSRIANEIVVVRDGESAVDFLTRQGDFAGRQAGDHPALVLLDLKLPGIDGLEVLRRIRSNPETKRVPVAILTTSDDDADIVRGYDLGVNSYIRKPVDFSAFTAMVEQLGLYWLVVNVASPT
jgi:two-component system response regulator